MPYEHSISKKAVSDQMAQIFSTIWHRKPFQSGGVSVSFKRWLAKHTPVEQEIISGYVFGILSDTERRIALLRKTMEEEIFYKVESENGTDPKSRKH